MRKRRRVWLVSIVGVLAVLSSVAAAASTGDSGGVPEPGSSWASPVVGSDFRISGGEATEDEWWPAVAHNPTANQYLVVWRDARNRKTRGSDIYGQLVGANGSLAGGNFRISGGAATEGEGRPAVTYNPTGNQYLVVWRDGRNRETRGSDIYGQRVRANGSLAGGNFRISGGAATASAGRPTVAYNPTRNQYLVVWEDGRNQATRGSDIYGQRVRANGNPAGTNFRISGWDATASEGRPTVAYNPTKNQYLVAWRDRRNQATRGYDIYGQRVAANGNRVGVNFRISGGAATANDGFPAVTYNPTGNQYLVVWRDGRNQATRGSDIYGQRVRANGNPAGGNFRISGGAATEGEGPPAVTYNPTENQYLIAWTDGRNQATRGYDIYGQRVTANGNRVEGNFRISGRDATANEGSPAVAYNPTKNQYLISWADTRNQATRGYDIYAQRVAE